MRADAVSPPHSGFCRKPLAQAVSTAITDTNWRRALALSVGIGMVSGPQAATFVADNLNDAGPGSLRQAVLQANGASGPDEIDITSTGTITLTTGELYITDDLTINGPGAANLTISGNNTSRVFTAGFSDLTISDVTVSGGNAQQGSGGGIESFIGSLTLINTVVSGNTASGSGGGISMYGDFDSLDIQNSSVTANSSVYGDGGGISLNGKYNTLSITGSTISGNTSSGSGGGLDAREFSYLQPVRGSGYSQTFSIADSTISGNSSTGSGGGGLSVDLYYASAEVINSTVSGNQAQGGSGGGVRVGQNTTLFLAHSTVSGNSTSSRGGGLATIGPGILNAGNSIVAGNSASVNGPDLYSEVSSMNLSWTLVGNSSATGGGINNIVGNLLDTDPQLGPLQDNGGPTLTHMPAAGSPVINAGDPADVAPPANDQRGTGFPRFIGTVDMGAVEVDVVPNVTLGLTGSPFSENGGSATVTATLSSITAQNVTVNLGLGGTALNGIDYSPSATSISIPAGSVTGSITLNGIDDTLDEAAETVVVDISSVTNGNEAAVQQVTATVTDDDAPPVVNLALGTRAPFSENGGSTQVLATLNAVSGLPVTVDLGFTGTATNSVDYTESSNQILIPAGQTNGNIVLTGIDDLLVEGDETVITSITGLSNATLGGATSVTETILDDDVNPAPPPAGTRPIPTLSGWALWLLSLLVPGLAVWRTRSLRAKSRE